MDYGAQVNCVELQTQSIQKCIDDCHIKGGGKIIIPKGKYLIASLRLYSNMTLYLESGAILLGSKDYQDYEDFKVPTTIQYLYDDYYIGAWHLPKYYFYAMITAFQAENIKVIGEPGSIIDGSDVFDANGEEAFRGPMGIIMSSVTNLELAGYIFQNSANWSHTLDGCDDINIHDVMIRAGHDGFNLHHSKNINVFNCHLETGDDCFAGYDINNLEVNQCTLNTSCNSLRVGGKNLSFKQCTYIGPGHFPHLSEDSYYTHAIFKYYAIDADQIQADAENILIENAMIDNADCLLVYDFGKKELMQNNQPLRSLSFESSNISNIRYSSIFKGNGEKVILKFKNCQIDVQTEKAFLLLDSFVALIFENVNFITSVCIEIDGVEKLHFSGQVSFFKRG